MKHKRLTALVLAAALVLAGCGGTKSSSGSAAASQSTGSSQNAPALAVQKELSITIAGQDISNQPIQTRVQTVLLEYKDV